MPNSYSKILLEGKNVESFNKPVDSVLPEFKVPYRSFFIVFYVVIFKDESSNLELKFKNICQISRMFGKIVRIESFQINEYNKHFCTKIEESC